MGLIATVFSWLFGGGRNAIKETAEVFVENAEAAATREQALRAAVLAQFAAEFDRPRKGLFDRAIDGINRLPRPALAMGTLGLFVSAMVAPIWFAERMQGIALVPEPLWWLLGAIISFYFGARHQTKGQDFQRSIAQTLARAPAVAGNLRALETLRPDPAQPLDAFDAAAAPNAALADWRTGE